MRATSQMVPYRQSCLFTIRFPVSANRNRDDVYLAPPSYLIENVTSNSSDVVLPTRHSSALELKVRPDSCEWHSCFFSSLIILVLPSAYAMGQVGTIITASDHRYFSVTGSVSISPSSNNFLLPVLFVLVLVLGGYLSTLYSTM